MLLSVRFFAEQEDHFSIRFRNLLRDLATNGCPLAGADPNAHAGRILQSPNAFAENANVSRNLHLSVIGPSRSIYSVRAPSAVRCAKRYFWGE